MSNIPYNYQKYIDDVTKMRQRGTISSGEQTQSPTSAGSRGLARTTDFTNSPNQIMKANMTESFSFENMKDIISRIDRIQSGAEAVQEDVDMDALKKWYEKYSKYQGLNGDKLPFGLYMQMAQTGVPTDGMEAGEARQAIADQNPNIDPNDAESLAGSAEEIPDVDFEKANQPITDAMKQELMDIMGVDAIGEEEITKAMKMLGVSTGMESYEPFPEADEMTFEDDDEFFEAFGYLGFPEDETELFDAEYRGRKVPLNKPMRGDVKKFKVYVKDPKTGNVKKVNFGHGGSSARKAGQKTMKIRKSNPKARKSFRARHNCANPGPKTKARYWSCRKW